MKIRKVRASNHSKAFEVETSRGVLRFPYARVTPLPSERDRIVRVFVDPELGREAFTYQLASGREGSVHVDAVLDENRDPEFMADLLAYELTVEAERRMKDTPLSHREICRRLGTSPAQLYRVLDSGNTKTSLRQLVALLGVLGCEVELHMKDRVKRGRSAVRRVR